MILKPTIAKAFKPLGRLGYLAVKHAPKILLVLGIGGYAGSVVLATKAPEKAKAARDGYLRDHDKKKFIKGYALAWAPTVGLFAASTAAVTGGHVILRGRYLAAGAALTATRKAFAEYRQRVVAKEGKDADICYRHGFTEKVELTDAEDGKEAEVVHTLEQTVAVDPHDYYIHVFDERNGLYVEGDAVGNLKRLKLRLEELNCMYSAALDDKLTLKEALVKSGFRYALRDRELARFAGRVGWDNHSDRGDHYISFGPMFEKILDDPRDYIMGRTPPLIIEFNCDGDIYA